MLDPQDAQEETQDGLFEVVTALRRQKISRSLLVTGGEVSIFIKLGT